jgi:proteasome lid subunit RPN8/RPN11
MAEDRFQTLSIPRSVYEGMLWHALVEQPLECCGLLAGVVRDEGFAEVRLRYPLVNAAASPLEFESDAGSHVSAWNDIRRQELEVLAVYHSHPTSEPVPSRKDLERNNWPQAVALIISLIARPPKVRGWWLDAQTYQEAQWSIRDQ